MTRKLPIVPTLVVAAAAAVMVWLGFWQLQRAHWKEGLLAQYAAAGRLPPVAWPVANRGNPPLFRRALGRCDGPTFGRTSPGENADGVAGYAFIADCASGGSVAVGWSRNPTIKFDWRGGPVSGIVTADPQTSVRLIADRAPPPLETLKPPSLDSIPNNHRFYALQWFFFAATAVLIYVLALRRKRDERA